MYINSYLEAIFTFLCIFTNFPWHTLIWHRAGPDKSQQKTNGGCQPPRQYSLKAATSVAAERTDLASNNLLFQPTLECDHHDNRCWGRALLREESHAWQGTIGGALQTSCMGGEGRLREREREGSHAELSWLLQKVKGLVKSSNCHLSLKTGHSLNSTSDIFFVYHSCKRRVRLWGGGGTRGF